MQNSIGSAKPSGESLPSELYWLNGRRSDHFIKGARSASQLAVESLVSHNKVNRRRRRECLVIEEKPAVYYRLFAVYVK